MPAKGNVYIQRAYDVLEEISADEAKRMEYNTQQKWLYDIDLYTCILEKFIVTLAWVDFKESE